LSPANLALLAGAGLAGLASGAASALPICRVPRRAALTGRRVCPDCGQDAHPRRGIERGSDVRCRPAHFGWFVQLCLWSNCALFVLAAWRIGWSWQLPAYLVAAAVGVAAAIVDVRTRRIPDALVLPAYPVVLACLVGASIASGDVDALVRGGIGGIALLALYFLAAVALPGGLGMGDVKLAGLLGLLLAYRGLSELAVGALAAFLLGGLWGVVALAGHRRTKGTIAFAPWMVLGAVIGVGWGQVIGRAVLRVIM
jgi:leader peptidase (prepilin peptidase)/N-methyltransferase